jgi:hypothetical protein
MKREILVAIVRYQEPEQKLLRLLRKVMQFPVEHVFGNNKSE